jgi:hypothetical protein
MKSLENRGTAACRRRWGERQIPKSGFVAGATLITGLLVWTGVALGPGEVTAAEADVIGGAARIAAEAGPAGGSGASITGWATGGADTTGGLATLAAGATTGLGGASADRRTKSAATPARATTTIPATAKGRTDIAPPAG